MIDDLDINGNVGHRHINSSTINNPNHVFEKKSTFATSETKSLTKRNTLQRKSSRENQGANLQPTNEN